MDHEALGEVLGELLGIDSMGDLDGVGRRRHRRHHGHRGHHSSMPIIQKPQWRQHQVAPGILSPREGREPLALTPNLNNGIFSTTVVNIDFTARTQRPFQATRLAAQVLRTGASTAGVAVVTTGIFMGTALQQLSLGNYSLEFFTTTAFDMFVSMAPIEPGIDVTIRTTVNPTGVIAGTDTIQLQLLLLGNSLD